MRKVQPKTALHVISQELRVSCDEEIEIVKNAIESLELLKECGIALVVPESECLNNERLTIQLYKKHATQEQWEKLLELFDIK